MALEISPTVSMHNAFKRDAQKKGDTPIPYVRLEEVAETFQAQETSLLRKIWDSPKGSVEEEARARQAAVGYLILTGSKLQSTNAREQQKLTNHFTEASIELYGKPDVHEARRLAALLLQEFEGYGGNESVDQNRLSRVIDYLKTRASSTEVTEIEDYELDTALKQLGEVLQARYGRVLELFEMPGKDSTEKIPAEEVAQLFQKGIDKLAEEDSAWHGWKVGTTTDSAPSTDSRRKFVGVGCNPREIHRLKLTFAHEVLGHALRCVNGSKTGDEYLQYGMPGYNAAEEGVAVILAASFRGGFATESATRYLDTASALGELGQPAITRAQLHQLHLDRQVIRQQINGNIVNESELEDKSWTEVNRIYRGLRGDETTGANTHDTSYHQGVVIISNWLKEALAGGKSPDEVFEILTSAKIDPTNPRDIEYYENHKSNNVK